MHKLLSIVFPAHPTRLYLFTRSILVLGICLFFLFQFVRTWTDLRQQPSDKYIAGAAKEQSQPDEVLDHEDPGSAVDIQAIIERNIFGGSPAAEDTVRNDTDVELEEIPLAENIKDIQLIGTIISSSGPSWAIIEDSKSKQQELKKVGDRVKNARIIDILRNNVIVNDGQQDAALSIDYKVRGELQVSSAPKSQGSSGAEDEQAIVLDRAEIAGTLAGINDVLEQARIQPHLEQGVSVGLQISDIQGEGLFHSLRLQDGDILVSTETSDLRTPQGIMDLIQELETEDAVRLNIRRNGQDMTMRYEVQ
jgi:general secretion pathway protein C